MKGSRASAILPYLMLWTLQQQSDVSQLVDSDVAEPTSAYIMHTNKRKSNQEMPNCNERIQTRLLPELRGMSTSLLTHSMF